jgi:mannose-6-phosphate isomerase class I
LSLIEVSPGREWVSPDCRSLEIVVCVDGAATVREPGGDAGPLELRRGQSLAIPAVVPRYELTGQARIFRAAPGTA